MLLHLLQAIYSQKLEKCNSKKCCYIIKIAVTLSRLLLQGCVQPSVS